jgi:hypothetical protein
MKLEPSGAVAEPIDQQTLHQGSDHNNPGPRRNTPTLCEQRLMKVPGPACGELREHRGAMAGTLLWVAAQCVYEICSPCASSIGISAALPSETRTT